MRPLSVHTQMFMQIHNCSHYFVTSVYTIPPCMPPLQPLQDVEIVQVSFLLQIVSNVKGLGEENKETNVQHAGKLH